MEGLGMEPTLRYLSQEGDDAGGSADADDVV